MNKHLHKNHDWKVAPTYNPGHNVLAIYCV